MAPLKMNIPTTYTIVKPSLTKDDEMMLTDSIKMLMKELQSDVPDLFNFQAHSLRLYKKFDDPPFEIICYNLAMLYHFYMCIRKDPVYVAKELFEMSRLLSIPCNALKKVAVIAPIIQVLHKSCVGLSKADVFLGREIKNLLERIVSYIVLYCGMEDQKREIEKLSYCFKDLMHVWTVNQVESDRKPVDYLRLFFPLLTDEVRHQLSVCYKTDCLAAVVMVEILILTVQFKLSFGVDGVDYQMEIRAWVVQTLKEFKNYIFYDMLLRMMLEPSLPVTTLLSSEEEIPLRRVLYDAVLLGELPFLKSGRFSQLHESHLKNIFLAWLLVADNAIDFAREHVAAQDAIIVSYTDAFSRSDIPNMLIELVANQIGMKEKLSRPNTTTPKSLIKWLLSLQDHGIRVFEDCSTLHAKAIMCSLRQDYGLLGFKSAGDYPTPHTFLDLNGANKVCVDQEMVHSLHSPISTVACAVNLTSTHGRRKRDEEMNEEEPQAKIVKCDFRNSPVTVISLPPAFGDPLISGSQGYNTASGLGTGDEKKRSPDDADEEMEDIE
ncbi:uncharacterized protein LOC141671962 isoform X1 [Apium graveolens]|uniref:uncharacterized protein LOC141671962 isoform X1 n=1 Tax=Apium graveolens TaxID=4045 RepID=UPI003D7951B2